MFTEVFFWIRSIVYRYKRSFHLMLAIQYTQYTGILCGQVWALTAVILQSEA